MRKRPAKQGSGTSYPPLRHAAKQPAPSPPSMGTALLQRLALLILLATLASCQQAGNTTAVVADGTQFLAALAQAARTEGPGSSVIEIQGAAALSPSDAAAYTLPLTVLGNRTLVLQGVGGGRASLDFGNITQLLYMGQGTRLVLSDLDLTGSAHKAVLGASYRDPDDPEAPVHMPTRAEAFQLFPTINGDAGFSADVLRVHLTLPPSPKCTPEFVAQQAATLQSTLGNTSALYAEGLTIHVVLNDVNLPVLNSSSGAQVGTMHLVSQMTNSTCPQPAASTAASGGSSGPAGWVWAVVGVAAAGCVAAAAAGAVIWQRKRKRHRCIGQQLKEGGFEMEQGSTDATSASAAAGPMMGSPEPAPALASRPQSGSLTSAGSADHHELWKTRVGFIDGLRLGGIVGGGGFGRVYKGNWKGSSVAVKIVPAQVSPGSTLDLSHEPLLSLSLSHPNVLSTYKTCVVRVLSDIGPGAHPPCSPSTMEGIHTGGGSPATSGGRVVRSLTDRNSLVEVVSPTAVLLPGMYETWLVLEWADRKSLHHEIKSGVLKRGDPPTLDLPVTLLCLLDVARGLEYLHGLNIIHADLKPQNVLLVSEKRDRRGFVCKLADFGLSRMLLSDQTYADTGNFGTVSHAAPERLAEGRITKATDIYALGHLIHELVTGSNPFTGMAAMQIISLVTLKGYRPDIPPGCHPKLASLMRGCWQAEPRDRPHVAAVVSVLISIAAELSQSRA